MPSRRDMQPALSAFEVAADPARMAIMLFLFDAREGHVGALAEAAGVAQPSASHHLALMRLAGLAVAEQRGKRRAYKLTSLGRRVARLAASLVPEGATA